MCYRKSKILESTVRDLRLKWQFNHRMNLQRERERALNVRDSRKESKTNIQREREIGKIY